MSGNAPKNPWSDTDPDASARAHPLPDPDRAPQRKDAADPVPDGPMGAPPENPEAQAVRAARAKTEPPQVAPTMQPASDPSPSPGPWARSPAKPSPAAVAADAAAAMAVGGMVLGQMNQPKQPTPQPGAPPRPNQIDLGQPMGLSRTDFFAAIKSNRRKTFVLCALLILIGVILGFAVGWAFGVLAEEPKGKPFAVNWGVFGALFMLVFSLLWTAIALTTGDKIMLSMTGAREVGSDEEQMLNNVVEEMALAAGLPKPRIFMIETDALNAFATGLKPEKAVIGVTRGLVRTLNRDELQGVIGHEMSHIANNDILYMTAVGVLVGLIALVSELALRSIRFMPSGRGKSGGLVVVAVVVLLLVGLLSPIAAAMVQMAVSRQREYLADASSVKLTRNPWGLIGALRKLDAGQNKWDGASKATQHLFISNPFKNFSEKSSALMSTHPAIELRIKRLTDLG